MVRRFVLRLGVALLLLAIIMLPASVAYHYHAVAASSPAGYTINDANATIYVPANAVRFQPLQVLVALHGMGGNGSAFCQDLLTTADRNGWIVLAPTFRYQDYKNPALVLQDDTTFLPRVKLMFDTLPERTGLAIRPRVLLYGHSRGGQAAHRFATFYPDRVLGVATLSAGSYTLPLNTMLVDGKSVTLPLPYGVADLKKYTGASFNDEAFRQISFWVAVGAQDNNPNDTPRAWDSYAGRTRVERARAYTKALQDLGVQSALTIYPDARHAVTPQMRAEALAFLQGVADQNTRPYGLGPVRGSLAYGVLLTAAMKQVQAPQPQR